jgi:Ca2+-binding EF-hand superfamily protein
MRTLVCAVLICSFAFIATTASAQFAKNSALRAGNKPAEADPLKAADKPADAGAVDPAAAAAAGGAPNTLFAALDIDGDGVISKTELRKAMASLRKLDTDNDGNLTLAECSVADGAAGGAAVAKNDQAQWLERIMAKDKNGDGRLTPDELTENERQMLQGADQNNDGAVDRQELMAMANNRNMRNGVAGGNLAGGAGGLGAAAGRRGGNEAMGRFFQYDRNHDGRLTADEVPPQVRGMLQGADLNGDGAIDAGELQALAARMGDRMKAFGAGVDPNGAAGAPGENDPLNRKRLRNGN